MALRGPDGQIWYDENDRVLAHFGIEVAELSRLEKDGVRIRAVLVTHPVGLELRVTHGHELWFSHAHAREAFVRARAALGRRRLMAKGWRLRPS